MTVLVLSTLMVAACGGGSGVTPGKKIALLMQDSPTAINTRGYFEDLVTQVCPNCQVLYSAATTDAEQKTQATTAISGGANVMVLDPVHGATAAAIVAQAKAANIPVVSFDRMIANTPNLSYFVSFDTASAGGLIANSLLTALGTKAKPTVVEIDGDSADPATKTFKAAALAALNGTITPAKQFDTPGGTAANAKAETVQAMTDLNFRIDGVLAANDKLAGGAIAAMKGNIRPWPPITGQGAELAAIQRIVTGDQYMTLYFPAKAEAEAAAHLAYDIAFGITVPPSMSGGQTVNNGSVDVPAVLVTPVVVTKVNIEATVVADGYWTADQICTSDFISACAAAGIA
ncbi:MAG TPA: substrate-binding domain-containing protein [Candidatus Acidoferrum sp.]|nr:substrate-binding domain-containing protein [Candidatus Acidoferrum sp.]